MHPSDSEENSSEHLELSLNGSGDDMNEIPRSQSENEANSDASSEEEDDDSEDSESEDDEEEKEGDDDKKDNESDGSGSDLETEESSEEGSENDDEVPMKRARYAFPEDVDSDSSDGQSEKCPICLSRFLGQEIGTPENCDHVFCLECIMEWSKNMNTCPVDRQVFELVFVRRTLFGKAVRRIQVQDQRAAPDEQEDLTYCEVCGRCDREDRLLLCDGCDMGFHLECLTPPLATVPVDEWFCPDCDTENHSTDEDGAENRARPPLNRTRGLHSQGRLLPRTRQSERVRRTIQRSRATRTVADPNQPSTSSGESVSPGRIARNPRTKSTSSKRKTLRKRKQARKRKRKTTKKKRATGRKTTSKVGKKRKGRRRRKKTGKRRVIRKEKCLPIPSTKARLAEQLGVKKMLPNHFLPVFQSPSRSRFGHSRHADLVSTGLQLFGQRNELDPFTEGYIDDEGGDVGTMRVMPAHRRNVSIAGKTLSPSAILSHRPVAASPVSRLIVRRGPLQVPAAASTSPKEQPQSFDLLGNILDSQAILKSSSKDITILRDGSLQLNSTQNNSPPASQRPGDAGHGSRSSGSSSHHRHSHHRSSSTGMSSVEGGGGYRWSSRNYRGSGGMSEDVSSGRSSYPDHHKSGEGGGHGCSSSGTSRKHGKRHEKEAKKPVAADEEDIDIYSDIETGFEEEDDGGHQLGNMDNLSIIDGDSPDAEDGDAQLQQLQEGEGEEDDDDEAANCSDACSENGLVIDESVKQEDEEDELELGDNEDDSSGSNLVIDEVEEPDSEDQSATFQRRTSPREDGSSGDDAGEERGEEREDEEEQEEQTAENDVAEDGDEDAENRVDEDAENRVEEEEEQEEEEEEEEEEVDEEDEVDDAENDVQDKSSDHVPDGRPLVSQEHDDTNSNPQQEEPQDGVAGDEEGDEDADEQQGEEEEEEDEDEPQEEVDEEEEEREATAQAEEAVQDEQSAQEEDAVQDKDDSAQDEPDSAREEPDSGREEADEAQDDDDAAQDDDDAAQDEDDAVQNEDGAVQDEDGAVQDEDGAVQDEDGAVQDEDDAVQDEEAVREEDDDEEAARQEESRYEDVVANGDQEEGEEEEEEQESVLDAEAVEAQEGNESLEEEEEDDSREQAEQDGRQQDSQCDHVDNEDAEMDEGSGEPEEVGGGAETSCARDEPPSPSSIFGDEPPSPSSRCGDDNADPQLSTNDNSMDILAAANSGSSMRQEAEEEEEQQQRSDSPDQLGVSFAPEPSRLEMEEMESVLRDKSPVGRLGRPKGSRDYEEGEIVDSPPPRKTKSGRKSRTQRTESPDDYNAMPRINIAELPRIPKIKRDSRSSREPSETAGTSGGEVCRTDSGGGGGGGSGSGGGASGSSALEVKRTGVLARLDTGSTSEISWKKLSQKTRTRNYRDGKPKSDRKHARSRDSKESKGSADKRSSSIAGSGGDKRVSISGGSDKRVSMSAGADKRVSLTGGGGAGTGGPSEESKKRTPMATQAGAVVADKHKEKMRDVLEHHTKYGDPPPPPRHQDGPRHGEPKVHGEIKGDWGAPPPPRSKERSHEKRSGSSKHKDKHREKHRSEKHKEWKEKHKHGGSSKSKDPGGSGSDRVKDRAHDKYDKMASSSSSSLDKEKKKEQKRELRKELERLHREEKHREHEKQREHKKQRDKEKVMVISKMVAPPPVSREVSPIESKEVYASGDSIIVNVNFTRPMATTASKENVLKDGGGAKLKDGGGDKATPKIKDHSSSSRKLLDPGEPRELKKQQRLLVAADEGEAPSYPKDRFRDKTSKKRELDDCGGATKKESKRSKYDESSRFGHREVIVKSASQRWEAFGDDSEVAISLMDADQKSISSGTSPIIIADDDDGLELGPSGNDSDDDVVIIPSGNEGNNMDATGAPVGDYGDEDLSRSPLVPAGSDEGGDLCHYDSAFDDPVPCSPPSPAEEEDNNSAYDPFEPTKSPSPTSSPEQALLQPPKSLMSSGSNSKTDNPELPPLPPELPPLPPEPEPDDDDDEPPSPILEPTATATTVASTTMSAVQAPPSAAAPGSMPPVPPRMLSPPQVGAVAPSPTSVAFAPPPLHSPGRGHQCLPPTISLPNVRVPPPNYIPRTLPPPASGMGSAGGAGAPGGGAPVPLSQIRQIGWPVVGAPNLLFPPSQQLLRAAGNFLAHPPPMPGVAMAPGSPSVTLTQIGTLLHSQAAQLAMLSGVRPPPAGHALSRIPPPHVGLPPMLHAHGTLPPQQQQPQFHTVPSSTAVVALNGEVKRSQQPQHDTTEVIDMDVDSPYSPGGDVLYPPEPAAPPAQTSEGPGRNKEARSATPESGARPPRDRFDSLLGSVQSRKENVPAKDRTGGGGGHGFKGRGQHGATAATGSKGGSGAASGRSAGSDGRHRGDDARRRSEAQQQQRKHIVRFEIPERQAKGGRGGKDKRTEDGKKEVTVKMDETQLKILDELPSSAVEMQVKEKFLKKLNRQERVIEEVKLAIKPYYNRKEINKEEYKEILRKSVPKICHNKSGEINPVKIKALVEGYVKKFRYHRKKDTGTKVGMSKKS